jgi:hypothetical protein
MTDDSADVPVIVDMIDFDTTLYRLRLKGVSIRELARQFKCSQVHVKEAIERACEPIDAFTRGRMLQIELERLESLTLAHSEAALNGDVPATAILIKIAEHRAALAGLFASAAARVDPVQLVEAGQQPNTTEKIQRVLDELSRPRLVGGKDVDQTTPDDGAPGEAEKTGTTD